MAPGQVLMWGGAKGPGDPPLCPSTPRLRLCCEDPSQHHIPHRVTATRSCSREAFPGSQLSHLASVFCF